MIPSLLTPESEKPTKEELRSKIMQLEAVLLSLPQIEIPIEHHFAPGLYLRQMSMPVGSVVTGKIHKTEHLCVLAKGSVIVVTDTETKTYDAPAVVHSLPGTKRALHALSDVVWINCHHNPSNEKDLEKIDSIYVTNTYEEFLTHQEQLKLEGSK